MALYHLYTLNGNIHNLLAAHIENHISLQSGGRIVNVHNSLLTSLNGFEGALQKLLTALCQHLHHHIVGNHLSVYELTQKIILNLAGRRKSDLDFLKAQLNQIIKKLNFL